MLKRKTYNKHNNINSNLETENTQNFAPISINIHKIIKKTNTPLRRGVNHDEQSEKKKKCCAFPDFSFNIYIYNVNQLFLHNCRRTNPR